MRATLSTAFGSFLEQKDSVTHSSFAIICFRSSVARSFAEKHGTWRSAMVTLAPPVTRENVGTKLGEHFVHHEYSLAVWLTFQFPTGVVLLQGSHLGSVVQSDAASDTDPVASVPQVWKTRPKLLFLLEFACFYLSAGYHFVWLYLPLSLIISPSPQILYIDKVTANGWAASAGLAVGMRLHRMASSTGDDGMTIATGGEGWTIDGLVAAINAARVTGGPAIVQFAVS